MIELGPHLIDPYQIVAITDEGNSCLIRLAGGHALPIAGVTRDQVYALVEAATAEPDPDPTPDPE